MIKQPGETTARLALTPEEIAALPLSLDIVTAGRLLGIGVNASRRLAREGNFPVETYRAGSRHRVAKHRVLAHLGIAA